MFDQNFFDSVYDRTNTGAIKYNNLPENTIPMWIADMDFKSPPAVTDALINVAQHHNMVFMATEIPMRNMIP